MILLGNVTFTNSNSIVAISDSANVYVLKIYPDFKYANEAFTTIKKPPLSLIDLLRLNPGSDTVLTMILSSNNRRYLTEAAQYYYENYGTISMFSM